MDYGKKKASKRQKTITSKSAMQGKRIGVRLFKAFLFSLAAVFTVGAAGGFIFLKKIIDGSPEISPEDVRPSGYTTFVLADDGKTELERFVASGSNRIYKPISEIPKHLQHAFVAIEDERFYKHNGVDPQGIMRAAVVGLTSGHFSEGASTITQQLIKNNVFPNFTSEKTFYDSVKRKLQEQFLALNIEKQMTKKEILESYLNTINLGQNTLGVQAASKRYFNKNVSDLTLSECAVIAGITQNPSLYNPITNPESNGKRRTKVLNDMLSQGYIDKAAFDEAMADDVYSRIQNTNNQIGEESPYSYFVDALAEQVISDLESRLDYTESQAYNALYSGGLTIYSTQNLNIQKICDEEMNNDANYPWLKEVGLSYLLTVTRADGTTENYDSRHIQEYGRNAYGDEQGLLFSSEDEARARVAEWKATIAREGDVYDEKITLTPQPQASVTLMDQSSGQIKALVGGRGAKPTSQSLNRAYTGSKRQPGSCFKILSTYAPALDAAGKSLADILEDKPTTYANGQVFKNATGRYMGSVTMRTAIIHSLNTCAVQEITDITPKLGFDYVKNNFKISTVHDKIEINGQEYSDMKQPLALGGLTEGVYNYQLCAAFASLANNGVYNSPTLYTKILDHDGNILLEGNPDTHTAVKDSTAGLITSALRSVVEEGTGKAAQLANNMPVAGKTGTTDHNVDLWFCGYTPYYTCCVWGGYDENKSLTGIDTTFRFRLWTSIMNRVHEGLEPKDFSMPASVEQKTICRITGKLARPGCPAVTEYFATEGIPDEVCPGHGGGDYEGDGELSDAPADSGDEAPNGPSIEIPDEPAETPEEPDIEIPIIPDGGETPPQ